MAAVYTRRQAALLLMLVVAAGAGLAIGHWRRAHPDVVDQLERLDEAPADDDQVSTASSGHRHAERRSSRFAATEAAASTDLGGDVRTRTRGGKIRSESRRAGTDDASAEQGASGPVDLNRATPGELTRLPGIGPVLAARIVAARESSGAFTSVDDLRRVSGIGPAKLERVRPHVVVTP